MIPVPNASTSGKFQTQLRGLKGKLGLVDSEAGNWDAGSANAPAGEWQPRRLGAAPPESLVSLRSDVQNAIVAVCGLPSSVLGNADGSLAREQLRQFLHVAIQLASLILASQIEAVLEVRPVFDFTAMAASDIAGRARAFGSLVAAGMPLDKAAAVSGVLVNNDDA